MEGPFRSFMEDFMKLIPIMSFLFLFSFNTYAEKCEGVNACVDLYSKLTGEHLAIDKDVTDEMTLAVPDTDLTKENAKIEFSKYANKNVMHVMNINKVKTLLSKRSGDFLTAPIYIVSENNIPMMINKDGPVTFVYHSKSNTSKLASKTRTMLGKKKPAKGRNSIIEFMDNKIIVVSDTYEKADKIAREWIKSDK